MTQPLGFGRPPESRIELICPTHGQVTILYRAWVFPALSGSPCPLAGHPEEPPVQEIVFRIGEGTLPRWEIRDIPDEASPS